MRLHWLRRVSVVVIVVDALLVGCQSTKPWPFSANRQRTQGDVAANIENSPAPRGGAPPQEGDASLASLQAASAAIDQAAASPEMEPRSYYAGRDATSSAGASSTCTSGCCR